MLFNIFVYSFTLLNIIRLISAQNTTEEDVAIKISSTEASTKRTTTPAKSPTSSEVEASFDDNEERLLIDLFRGYNSLIRPVKSVHSPPIIVDFGVAIILLINVTARNFRLNGEKLVTSFFRAAEVPCTLTWLFTNIYDEKNQILQTNVWLTMKWNDFQLRWDPREYGNISSLHVPSERVWLPDIVLFNNADGNYEVSFKSNAFIEPSGDVTWVPPARYLSSCAIDVEWFPFDQQSCDMVFGSWTYNEDEVQLSFYNNITAVQLNDYSYSGIWDVIDVPGMIVNGKGTSRIVFNIVMRRKTLFYTVILIIPTVLMAFLSMMAFYLPADSAEKISLTINILLGLVVFLLLVSKILPPTSNIPLMGKYLLMAFCLNITTVVVTVIIVNVYFRSPLSHEMPDCVRKLFLGFLPRILLMRRPERIPIFNGYFVEEYCASEIIDASLVIPSMTATIVPFLRIQENTSLPTPPDEASNPHHPIQHRSDQHTSIQRGSSQHGSGSHPAQVPHGPIPHHENCHNSIKRRSGKKSKKHRLSDTGEQIPMTEVNGSNSKKSITIEEKISREMKTTVESIAYIAEHMKAEMADKKIRDDWKYVAMVIDRLLLLIFFGITLGGTLQIILSAPHVFDFVDQEKIIKELSLKYNLV